MGNAELKTRILVFYKCRWCLVIYNKKLDLDYGETAEHFVEEVGGSGGMHTISKGNVRMSWMRAVHECNDTGRSGLADFVGARLAKNHELK